MQLFFALKDFSLWWTVGLSAIEEISWNLSIELNLTWFLSYPKAILLAMEKKLKPGRPLGAKTFEPAAARAFGAVVRDFRTELGVSQEELGSRAQIERSHMGKIERGLHLPNLAMILKLAVALSTSPGGLVDRTAAKLSERDQEQR